MIDALVLHPEMMLVGLPCFFAALLFAVGARSRKACVWLVLVAVTVFTSLLLYRVVTGGAYNHHLGGWGAPLGIVWRIDGLAAVMILLNTLVGVPVSIYSLYYFQSSHGERDTDPAKRFWPLWFLLWGSLYALFLSHDIFNWYVTLELSGLAAVALITTAGTAGAFRSALRYLLLALAASLFYLAGVAVLYSAYGVLDAESLRQAVTTEPYVALAMGLMVAGLCVKSALFPLHFWLPSAHASAPSPVSAVLSALVVKGGFYILLRLLTEVFPHATTHALGNGLGYLGSAAILWGSFHALRQQRLKMVIAYSTVAQLGYLFLMFPLIMNGWWIGSEWASRAWMAGIYQAFSHGLAKASLFLAAGVIIHARGNDRLDSLKGLGARLPMTVTAMTLAGISLMGIPPGAGFIAKWLMLTVSVSIGEWGWAIILVVGGLAAVGYLFRIFSRLMINSEMTDDTFNPPPRAMEVMVLLLAILSIGFGLSAFPLLTVLAQGAPAELGAYIAEIVP